MVCYFFISSCVEVKRGDEICKECSRFDMRRHISSEWETISTLFDHYTLRISISFK